MNLCKDIGGLSNDHVIGVVTIENFGPKKALLPGRLCPAESNPTLPPEGFCDCSSESWVRGSGRWRLSRKGENMQLFPMELWWGRGKLAPGSLIPCEKSVHEEEWGWIHLDRLVHRNSLSHLYPGITEPVCVCRSYVWSKAGSRCNNSWALIVGVYLETTGPSLFLHFSFPWELAKETAICSSLKGEV